MEEWISQAEYMKRYNMGFNVVKRMIANKELEVRETPGGQYKIKVGGDTVSISMYETERQRRIEAETTLNLIKNMLVGKEMI